MYGAALCGDVFQIWMAVQNILQAFCRHEKPDRESGHVDSVYAYGISQTGSECAHECFGKNENCAVSYQFAVISSEYINGRGMRKSTVPLTHSVKTVIRLPVA